MINFNYVKYKNFLSTGNAGNEIRFDKSSTVLVQGASGSGKSTMIDALTFGLFGKPFRNVNKPQIINSVNQKQCLVEVAFESNGINYRVVRGVKPNLFEIYANDKLIKQQAAIKDYQKMLEQQILAMSFKTFTQVVIIGSTAYTPFMELSPAGRREVIEDILDIGVFSIMNQLLKVQVQELKTEQAEIVSDIRTKKERAEGLQRLINALSSKQNNELDELKKQLERIEKEIDVFETEYKELQEANEPLKHVADEIKSVIEERNKQLEESSKLSWSQDTLNDNKNFFEQNCECPTCNQHISDDHKSSMVSKITKELDVVLSDIADVESVKEELTNTLNALKVLNEELKSNQSRMTQITASLAMLHSQQTTSIGKIQEKSAAGDDITEAKDELKTTAKEVVGLLEKKKDLATQREIQEAAAQLLRDTGIKTAIIKEYLPLINQFLNKYLNEMELYVDFHLDESFNEIIKSRHRDEFTYGNFSEGEKMRISLALLFTWRQIARLKNSASCNLLILDEILVGRLDQANSDIVINLINNISLDGTKVFAISHGDALQDKFKGLITFDKQGDFSVIL